MYNKITFSKCYCSFFTLDGNFADSHYAEGLEESLCFLVVEVRYVTFSCYSFSNSMKVGSKFKPLYFLI